MDRRGGKVNKKNFVGLEKKHKSCNVTECVEVPIAENIYNTGQI